VSWQKAYLRRIQDKFLRSYSHPKLDFYSKMAKGYKGVARSAPLQKPNSKANKKKGAEKPTKNQKVVLLAACSLVQRF